MLLFGLLAALGSPVLKPNLEDIKGKYYMTSLEEPLIFRILPDLNLWIVNFFDFFSVLS